MKKIRLELETLTVESFYLAEEGSPRGTVLGRSATDFDCVPTDPRYGGCVYPTAAHHSCQPGETVDQYTCNCLYPETDARMCCTGEGCSGMC